MTAGLTAASREPTPAEVQTQLERVLASRCFARASRASELLRFLVGQTLAGVGSRLKGYTIGVHVFGRPADFDPQTDPLVRVEAGRLRRRLLDYYADEGRDDVVRIELPRGSYSVVCRYAGPAVPAERAAPRRDAAGAWRRATVAVGVLLLAALGVIVYQQWALVGATRALGVLGEREGAEWPRLLVVPFENLSNEPQLDGLAASMTEEIMVVLAQLDLFVVATTKSWYGPETSDRDVSASAAGGYVLTGSVRGGEQQARIAVRLIEAQTGTQLWTAAYDQPLAIEQLPRLQERVARDVASVAAPYGPIFNAELARASRAQHTPELRDCLVKYYDYRRRIDVATYNDALLCFERVSERKPQIAQLWAGIAMLHLDAFAYRFTRDSEASLAAARAASARAMAIDRDNFQANLAQTRLQYFDGDPAFRAGIERAIALRPDSAEALAQGGTLLVISGDSAAGLPLVERAKALVKTPVGIFNFAYAVAYVRDGRYDAALAAAQQVDTPNWVPSHVIVAAAAGLAGRHEVAHAAARRILELDPEFEAEARADLARWHFDAAYSARLVAGLQAAGLKIAD